MIRIFKIGDLVTFRINEKNPEEGIFEYELFCEDDYRPADSQSDLIATLVYLYTKTFKSISTEAIFNCMKMNSIHYGDEKRPAPTSKPAISASLARIININDPKHFKKPWADYWSKLISHPANDIHGWIVSDIKEIHQTTNETDKEEPEVVRFRDDMHRRPPQICYDLRKDEIESFKEIIDRHFPLVITGKGGLGKTTTSVCLFNDLRPKYDRCAWIPYNDSLDESLLTAVTDRIKRDREERLRLIREYLFSDSSIRTLLVIDNVNVDFFCDEGSIRLSEMCQCPNIDLVITTRAVKHSSKQKEFEHFVWKSLSDFDVESACIIFRNYYTNELSDADEQIIEQIVKNTQNNPLIIELIAKAANQKNCSLAKFYEMVFGEGKFPQVGLNLEVDTYYSEEKNLNHILQTLYSMADLIYIDKEILWSFAILPNIIVNADIVPDIFVGRDAKVINDRINILRDAGWLSFDSGGYTMHDLIKTMIWNYNEKDDLYQDEEGFQKSTLYWLYRDCHHSDLADTSDFTHNSISIEEQDYSFCDKYNQDGYASPCALRTLSLSGGMMFVYNSDAIEIVETKVEILKTCLSKLRIPNYAYYELLINIAHYLFYDLGNLIDSESYYERAVHCFVWLGDASAVAQLFYEYGYLLSLKSLERYPEAVCWLKVALFFADKTSINNSVIGTCKCIDQFEDNLDLKVSSFIYFKYENEFSSVGLTSIEWINDNALTIFESEDLIALIKSLTSIYSYPNNTLHFSRVSEIRMFIKIINCLGCVLTHKEENQDVAEELLRISLDVREYLCCMLNLEGHSEAFIENNVKPYEQALKKCKSQKSLYKYVCGDNSNAWIAKNYADIINDELQYGKSVRDKSSYRIGLLNKRGLSTCFAQLVFSWNPINMILAPINCPDTIYELVVDYNLAHFQEACLLIIMYCLREFASTKNNLSYLLMHKTTSDKSEIINLLNSSLDMRRRLYKAYMDFDYSNADNYDCFIGEECLINLRDVDNCRAEISWTLNDLAELETDIGGKEMLDLATVHYLEAIKIREDLCNKTGGRYRDNKAWSCLGLARCYDKLGDEDNSRKYYDEAVALYTELAQENQEYIPDLKYVLSLTNLKDKKLPVGNQSHFSRKAIEKGKSL